jgi:hypothetical protein
MEPAESLTDTVFVVKENQEHCFLFDGDDPLELFRALLRCAQHPDPAGLTPEEAFEVLEGMVPERLRSI